MNLLNNCRSQLLVVGLCGWLALIGVVSAAQRGSSTKAADASAGWSLAGREGECAPLSLLKKKYPELADVKSPYEFAEKLKAQGERPEVKEHVLGKRPAVEVRVPEKNLYVMFIRTDLCGKQ